MFHPLSQQQIDGITLPERFTNPFDYTPHALVEVASAELRNYLHSAVQWHEEINRGKMFGVLVVENQAGELGFLAAFSGYLAGKTLHTYFTPPIVDLLDPNGFFLPEEANISQINAQIDKIDSCPELAKARRDLERISDEEQREIEALSAQYNAARLERRAQRRQGCSDEQLAALGAQSQQQKGAIRRRELHYRQQRAPLEELIEQYAVRRNELSEERKRRSAALQALTFSRFKPLNALGEECDLITIFKEYNNTTPPAGSGECAAPKLLHYAYANALRPIAMGEFWWGTSTSGHVRHHNHYYPACRGKCHPILSYMLRGLTIDEPRPRATEELLEELLTVIYEDDHIVAFNKPSGLASVRGLSHTTSVQSIAEKRYPHINPNNLVVHRLDMDTSGILVMAKDAATQRALQEQFAAHTIRKRYIALIDGLLPTKSGAIRLPLALDPLDRPRQRVDYTLGKEAYTHYTVLSHQNGSTRIALYPHTGRTHQLRIHCAHAAGLNTPIVGDRLYGTPAARLMLHAELITLHHPATNRKFTLRCLASF